MELMKRSGKMLAKVGTGPALCLISGVGSRKFALLSNGFHITELNCQLLLRRNGILGCWMKSSQPFSTTTQSSPSPNITVEDDEFQPLDVIRSRNTRFQRQRKRHEKKEVPPPRYLKMKTDQDWPSVWPTAKTFHPASVPLPLHQGYVEPNKSLATPNKFANLELMKIPNFLHLTPPAIRRHCEALKKFCTPWPKELKDNYVLENLFPIEILTNDYCHSSPSIRDSKARIVTLRIKVSFLNFDDRAKDKFVRLVGERYNPKTDELTLVTDCCPMRKQNYDYSMYLLTAIYHESCSKEKWEDEKSEADMEKYVWEGSKSEEILQKLLGTEDFKNKSDLVENYKDAVCDLMNQGESTEKVFDYGVSVRKLFNLPLPDMPSNPLHIEAKE